MQFFLGVLAVVLVVVIIADWKYNLEERLHSFSEWLGFMVLLCSPFVCIFVAFAKK